MPGPSWTFTLGEASYHVRSPSSLGLTVKVKGRHTGGQPCGALSQQPASMANHVNESP